MFDAAIKDYDRALSCIPDKYVAASSHALSVLPLCLSSSSKSP